MNLHDGFSLWGRRLFRKWRRMPLLIRLPVALILLFVAIWFSISIPEPLFRPDYSQVITDCHGNLQRVFLNEHQQWCFPPAASGTIPDKLKTALLRWEDRRFFDHGGVDFLALGRAFVQNIRAGRVVSGASTITMQLARMSDPKPRHILSKFIEMIQAWKLEIRYDKSRLLALYLNHAPFGGNIVGLRAASLRYFRREPDELSWSQAALLAVLPNAPALMHPGKNRQLLVQKRNRLLDRLYDNGEIDQVTLGLAKRESLPDRSYPFPFEAPHASRHLREKFPAHPVIQSTIDPQIQHRVETILQRRNKQYKARGIPNCAAIVVHTQSAEIAAWCGSQDFFDQEGLGQVDGVLAERSSGSTLKPFLYTLAFEKGLVLPQTKIEDIPLLFGAYEPRNADHKYLGLVSVSDALIQSRNVPAVLMLNRYGLAGFHSALQRLGFGTIRQPSAHYGLVLIIGGAEVRLYDLAQGYRCLGDLGRFRPLRLCSFDPAPGAEPYLHPGASFQTLGILSELNRPGIEHYWRVLPGSRRIAWKTGTSFGGRDAWAVGVNPEWTIAVWVGDFRGGAGPGLYGTDYAGPVLFEILNALPVGESRWYELPEHRMISLEICRESGLKAGRYCTQIDTVLVPDEARVELCHWHRRVEVDNDERFTVCPECWQTDHHHSKVITQLPLHTLPWLRKRGVVIPRIPPHNPDCPAPPKPARIRIHYPSDGTTLSLPRGSDGKRHALPVRVATDQPENRLYWYLDGIYIGNTTNYHNRRIEPEPGQHTLEVIDETGGSARCGFSVLDPSTGPESP